MVSVTHLVQQTVLLDRDMHISAVTDFDCLTADGRLIGSTGGTSVAAKCIFME